MVTTNFSPPLNWISWPNATAVELTRTPRRNARPAYPVVAVTDRPK
jgi:hypothetical protein